MKSPFLLASSICFIIIAVLFSVASSSCFATTSNKLNMNPHPKIIGKTTSSLSSHTYNQTETLRAWFFCKVSGCKPSQMQDFSCPPCETIRENARLGNEKLTDMAVFHNNSLHSRGYVAYSPSRNQIIVTYRGSRSIGHDINWIENFNFTFIPATFLTPAAPEGAMIHGGFYKMSEILRASVKKHVALLLKVYPTASIYGAAHSLGAADLQLSTIELALAFPETNIHSVHTFGAPRVGNYVFAKWSGDLLKKRNIPMWRNVNRRDIVPKLPFLQFAYVGMSHEVYYPLGANTSEDRAAVRVCNDEPGTEDLSCSDSISILDGEPSDHEWYCGVFAGCNRDQP